jgi:hypothetical protein
MLTDILVERYVKRILWEHRTGTETTLLTQCFRIIEEQLIPYYDAKGQQSDTVKVSGRPSKIAWYGTGARYTCTSGIHIPA